MTLTIRDDQDPMRYPARAPYAGVRGQDLIHKEYESINGRLHDVQCKDTDLPGAIPVEWDGKCTSPTAQKASKDREYKGSFNCGIQSVITHQRTVNRRSNSQSYFHWINSLVH